MRESVTISGARASDLVDSAKVFGNQFRIRQPDGDPGRQVLAGLYRVVRLRSGLILHASDATDMHDLVTQVVQQPGITCSVFLAGRCETVIGGRRFMFGPEDRGPGCRATIGDGLAISRVRPELFERRARRGMRLRKVNVTITREWLDEAGIDDSAERSRIFRFAEDHLASHRWRPTPRLISLAEQILHPPEEEEVLQNLYLESRAIEIVGEALRSISQADSATDTSLRPADFRRMGRVQEFLDAHPRADFSVEDVAREVGMSANALQRTFRSVYGTTIFEFARNRRLERARDALENEGISVSEAAFLAGYSSPANFATAFKRAFGVAPKYVRARV